MSLSRSLQYLFLAIVTISVGFSLYQWNASRAAVKLQQSTSVNLASGLVGYWSFDGDDVSGTTAYDRSGSGNNGTLTNGPTRTAGRIGQALNFDGVDDYVSIPNSSTFNVSTQVTYSVWVKLTALPGTANGYSIVRKVVNATEDKTVGILQNGKPYFYLYNTFGGSVLSGNTVLVIGEWYHIAGIYDGTTAKIYVNGVLDNSKSASGDVADSTGTVAIGASNDGANPAYMNGSIDEPRIYNRALTATEIQSLYDLGNPDKVNTAQGDPLEQGLVGYWKLDDASGTSATDSSGNSNTGTLTNGPTWGTGRIGSDVVFDGVDDRISSASNIDLANKSFTVAGWAKRTTTNTWDMLFSQGSVGGNTFLHVGFRDANFFTCSFYGSDLDTSQTYTDSNWHHWACTYDTQSNRRSIYRDGSLVVSAIAANDFQGSGTMYLGYYSERGSFHGSLDEMRIYNRALSDEEVGKLYRETAPDNPDTGLVGYWPFNGKDINGTTTYDRSGKGNNGTLTNGPTKTAGRVGQALTFDGVNQYVTTGNTTAFDNLFSSGTTLCAWAKFPNFSNFNRLITLENNAGTDYDAWLQVQQSSAVVQFGVGGTGRYKLGTTVLLANTWYHLCGVTDYTAGGTKIFINGAEDSGTLGGTPTYTSDKGTLDIGRLRAVSSSFYGTGSLDEPRIYNRALSAGEIQSLYDLGNPDKVNTAQGDPLEQGMVGYWKLDDASGTSATDSSGNGNTGTLTNGPTWTTGKLGKAINFDGVDDYVDIANQSNFNFNQQFAAYSLWFKSSANGMLISKGGGPTPGDGGWYIQLAGGAIQVVYKDGNYFTFVTTATTFADNNWHHLVAVLKFDTVTQNNNSATIYIDGVSQAGTPTNTGVPNLSSYSVKVGARSGVGGVTSFFTGQIDEVRIYNRALSDEEVTKLYRETTPDNPDTGLVGYWPMNGKDISGTTAYDRSGKGNNGTLTNGPTKTAGRIGQALNFDGTNDYVTVPTSSALNFAYNQDFSVLLWAKVPATQIDTGMVGNIILQKWSNGTGGYPYAIRLFNQTYGTVADRGKVYALRYDGTNAPLVVSGVKINDNTWHHIGYTKSGSTLSLYIDGTSSVVTGTDTTTGTTTNADSLYMGMEVGSLYQLTGSLDEPRIYNRALTAAEVATLYSAGR